VAQPGAGPGRGGFVLPEVEDEVLVAFDHGDIRRGYVLGGLYNGVDTPDPAVRDTAVGSDGRVATRSFTSRNGHIVRFSDADGDEFVEVATKDSEFSVKVATDAEGGGVIVTSGNVVKVDAQGDVTVTARGRVTVEATGDLALRGRSVAIDATTSVTVRGRDVTLAGTSSAELTGAQTKVGATASLDLDGGATANLHAGMVRIN
jgi:uncharacterized protein involved in type VI secretion and phage assembly